MIPDIPSDSPGSLGCLFTARFTLRLRVMLTAQDPFPLSLPSIIYTRRSFRYPVADLTSSSMSSPHSFAPNHRICTFNSARLGSHTPLLVYHSVLDFSHFYTLKLLHIAIMLFVISAVDSPSFFGLISTFTSSVCKAVQARSRANCPPN